MIEYNQSDREWFNSQVPYVPTNRRRLNDRLEAAISHRDGVDLAAASERITVREAPLNVDAQQERDTAKAQEENMQRDQERCEEIRAQAYLSGKRDEHAKLVSFGRSLPAYLGVMVAIALVVWMATR